MPINNVEALLLTEPGMNTARTFFKIILIAFGGRGNGGFQL
jgi:hypothetical protein